MQRGSTILIAIVAGALGGVGGGLSTAWLRSRPAGAKPAGPGLNAVTADVQDLANRVETLEAEVNRSEGGGTTPPPCHPIESMVYRCLRR